MNLHKDAFSSGQITSKIWLAEELENAVTYYKKRSLFVNPLKIVIVGGWYATTNFILQCRGNLEILSVTSIDIDEDAVKNANLLNENWVWKYWKFKSIVADANSFDYSAFDIVINTSIEHIDSKKWFDLIPEGKLCAFQSNDMDKDDHPCVYKSLKEFSDNFPLNDTVFKNEIGFVYPDWKFKRFMKIGIK